MHWEAVHLVPDRDYSQKQLEIEMVLQIRFLIRKKWIIIKEREFLDWTSCVWGAGAGCGEVSPGAYPGLRVEEDPLPSSEGCRVQRGLIPLTLPSLQPPASSGPAVPSVQSGPCAERSHSLAYHSLPQDPAQGHLREGSSAPLRPNPGFVLFLMPGRLPAATHCVHFSQGGTSREALFLTCLKMRCWESSSGGTFDPWRHRAVHAEPKPVALLQRQLRKLWTPLPGDHGRCWGGDGRGANNKAMIPLFSCSGKRKGKRENTGCSKPRWSSITDGPLPSSLLCP